MGKVLVLSASICVHLRLTLPGAAADPALTNPGGKPTVVPAALRGVSPSGARRGETVVFTLQGVNLSGATRVLSDDPAIRGEVLTPPIPLLNRTEVKVRATIREGARVGIHRMALQTPFGTTGGITFAVGGWPEVKERLPDENDSSATPLTLPATAIGAMQVPGDVDRFRFEARAGQELLFQVVAGEIRSRLNSVLTLRDASGRVVAQNNDAEGRVDSLLGHRFAAGGTYTVEIRDYENASGDDVHYRLNAGEFAYVTRAFPLGVRRGRETAIAVRGFNLGGTHEISVRGAPLREFESGWGATMPLPMQSAGASRLNEPRLAVGDEPEAAEAEAGTATTNDVPATAQRVVVPITINGRIARPAADCYRFSARKGQRLILEVAARRLGSPLDSALEILDARGKPIERATLRCVAETVLVLSDRDANSSGFRIQSWVDLAVNDTVFAGRELLRVAALPDGPDDDMVFFSVGGRRVGLLDTTPEHHSIGSPVYKVTVHPPGTQFAPNGMPVFRLYTRNDDGGAFYGKDSRIAFDPPADGEYVARLTDVEGRSGPDYAYRLTIRPPRPDFRLRVSPEQLNVPRGGSAPVEVTAERLDGYDGSIEVQLEGLPDGFSAPAATIAAGSLSATLTLSAAPDARTPDLPTPSPIRVMGRARIAGQTVVRAVGAEGSVRRLVALPEADLAIRTEQQQVTIRPGGQVDVTALIRRQNGFRGRVPIDVRNLPFGVRVLDIGLNGVLVTESESQRRFVLIAEPWVKPHSRPFYAVARVESDPSSELASPPIVLTVAPHADR
jgi:hypothetical protein